MTVSTKDYLKGLYNSAVALGDPVIVSDATFEIEGAEDISILVKQFPWPELSVGGEIEVPLPMGGIRYVPQQVQTAQQGQISFIETVQGHVSALMERIVANGGRFNATVYEGTPENHSRKCKIYDCFFNADNPDRDTESRTQIMLISGSLFFHYLGD